MKLEISEGMLYDRVPRNYLSMMLEHGVTEKREERVAKERADTDRGTLEELFAGGME